MHRKLLRQVLVFCILPVLSPGYLCADTAEMLREAESARMKGEYELSEQLSKAILADKSSNASELRVRGNLAMVYVLAGKQSQADAEYQTLVTGFKDHPALPDVINGIAYQYKSAKKYAHAVECYRRVVENWPDDDRSLWAQTGLANSAILARDYPTADTAADKLVRDFAGHKSYAQAVKKVASCWRRAGEFLEKANELDREVVKAAPQSVEAMWALVDLAAYNAERGNDAEALGACNRLISDFSDQKEADRALHQLASQSRRFGRVDLADQLDQHVAQNWPDSEYSLWALRDIAKSAIEIGDEKAADAAVVSLCAKKQERASQAVHDIASLYRRLDSPKADLLYARVVELWPDTEHALWSQKQLAMSRIDASDYAGAQSAVDTLLTQFGGHKRAAQAVHEVTGRFRYHDKYDLANQLCGLIVRKWPKQEHAVWAQRDLARFYITTGEIEKAQNAADKLLTEFASNKRIAQAARSIASHYRGFGYKDRADQLCQYIIEHWPNAEHAMWARRDLSMANLEAGRTTVETELEALLANSQDSATLPGALFSFGERYYNKAFSYERDGQNEQAEAAFRDAITIWSRIIKDLPDSEYSPPAYYLSAICYRRIGDYRATIEYCNVILNNWPGYKRAWHAQFMVGESYEELKRQGNIPASEADGKITKAYRALIENYPKQKITQIARKRLSLQQ